MHLHRPLITAALIAASPALGAVTPDQAKSVESQLQTWYAATFSKPGKPGAPAVQVEPAGDRYKIIIPLGLQSATGPLAVTALANPADNGRWVYDTLQLPQPFEYSLSVPQTKPPGEKVAPGPTVVHSKIIAATQEGSGVWDPTFATPSTFKQTMTGIVSTSTSTTSTGDSNTASISPAGETLTQRNTVDRSVTESAMKPNGRDKVDILTTATLTGYNLSMQGKDTPPIDVAAREGGASIKINGVPRERGVEVIRALADLFNAGIPGLGASAGAGAVPAVATKPGSDTKLSPAGYAAMRRVIVALPELGTDGSIEEAVSDLKVTASGKTFSASKVALSMNAKSVSGLLQATMGLSADGMVWPELGLGDMEQLLPKHFAMRPNMSGVSGKDMFDIILGSLDAEQKGVVAPEDAKSRLMNKGFTLGIESMEFDTAGTTVSGNASVTYLGGSGGTLLSSKGSAHIVAKDLDKLTAVVSAQPMLAQGVPAIVFLKGLAKQAEGGMVWDVTFDGTKLAVNGTDMTAMMGGK